MSNRTKKPRGLNPPNLLVSFSGWWDANVSKTAQLDPSTGCIHSGYIIAKTKLFRKYADNRIESLENELKSVRTQASSLMTEYARLYRVRQACVPVMHPDKVTQIRRNEEIAGRRAAVDQRMEEIRTRLMEISMKLRSRELVARKELAAAANALQSKFAVYGRGMRRGVLRAEQIPALEYEDAFDLYHQTFEKEVDRMNTILKEVYNDA